MHRFVPQLNLLNIQEKKGTYTVPILTVLPNLVGPVLEAVVLVTTTFVHIVARMRTLQLSAQIPPGQNVLIIRYLPSHQLYLGFCSGLRQHLPSTARLSSLFRDFPLSRIRPSTLLCFCQRTSHFNLPLLHLLVLHLPSTVRLSKPLCDPPLSQIRLSTFRLCHGCG